MLSHVSECPPVLMPNNVPLYGETTFGLSVHSLMTDTWVASNLLPVVTNASINMHVQICHCPVLISFGYIPPNGNAGSYTLFSRAALSLGVEMARRGWQYKV